MAHDSARESIRPSAYRYPPESQLRPRGQRTHESAFEIQGLPLSPIIKCLSVVTFPALEIIPSLSLRLLKIAPHPTLPFHTPKEQAMQRTKADGLKSSLIRLWERFSCLTLLTILWEQKKIYHKRLRTRLSLAIQKFRVGTWGYQNAFDLKEQMCLKRTAFLGQIKRQRDPSCKALNTAHFSPVISCLKGESRAVLTADAFVPNGSSSSLHPLVARQEKGQCQLLQASLAPSQLRSALVPIV